MMDYEQWGDSMVLLPVSDAGGERPTGMMMAWGRLVLTYGIIFFVPGALLKTGLMLGLWSVSFIPWKKSDIILFSGASLLFTFMNIAAIRRGIFGFTNPDVAGIPCWELFLWGFWVLHTHRVAAGKAAPQPGLWEWSLVILFASSFAFFRSSAMVLAGSGGVLIAALSRWHTLDDLRYVGAMILIGTLLEYPGVALDLWRYPDPPPGGVPLWYVTMWGGVGLFIRRWAAPLAKRWGGR